MTALRKIDSAWSDVRDVYRHWRWNPNDRARRQIDLRGIEAVYQCRFRWFCDALWWRAK